MKKNKKERKNIYYLLCILILISTIWGLYDTFSLPNFMSSRTLLFFTIQSNIIMAIVALILIYRLLANKKESKLFNIFQFMGTIGVTLTFLVFFGILVPNIVKKSGITSLISITNLTLHFATPILSIILFALIPNVKFKKHDYLYGTIHPLLYLFFILILDKVTDKYLFTSFNGSLSKFPYFFMDYHKNGIFTLSIKSLGLFWWIIIIAIIIILISKFLLLLNKKIKH